MKIFNEPNVRKFCQQVGQSLPGPWAPPVSEERQDEKQLPVIFGKRVFVADGNETNLTLMTELLEQDCHELAIARSGMQSLEILAARDFDVLFLDIGMKDMDGAKLLQIYRFGKLNAPPAFLLTAAATAGMSDKLLATGAVGFLHTPVTSKDELRHAIARVCEPGTAVVTAPVHAQVQTDTDTAIDAPAKTMRPALKVIGPQFIDRSVIEGLKSVSADPEFLRELLVVAAEDIGRIGDELAQALASGDFEPIRDQAHALKGVAASVGARRLAALAARLMGATPKQQGPAAKQILADLGEASQTSMAALLDIVAGLGGRPLPGPTAATGMGSVRWEARPNG